MTLEEKLAMVRQIRWQAAKHATGARTDECTTELIRAHHAVLALEAVIADGEPATVLHIASDGHVPEPNTHWSKL